MLNNFTAARNTKIPAGQPKNPGFSEKDITKLAYWMATGSGKTLIMHLNYRQFLHYNTKSLDNILLVTPNISLTEQHMEEMELSSIPCMRFSLEESGLGLLGKNPVRVIEITKLVQEKRGGGLSVPVEAFEGNNLIFVDEGHKGSGGEVWKRFRDALGETGFTFEYSATFGQALTASKNDQLTAEYGNAIAFDYSYRYFHSDGYGKDFHILNLKEETTEQDTETLLLGNLLSFYEQQRCYTEQFGKLRPYNLENPLWVFVGSSVNAVYSENKQKRSDVLTVARFLHHLMANKRNWVTRAIKKIIDGKTGISADGQDIFEHKFEYLRNTRLSPEALYTEILDKIFHVPTGGALHICDIRGQTGELGLKAGGAENYFGLIYIGDTSAFKKLVEADDAGIVIEEDVISGSLFEDINDPDTSLNLLIGAKKFMEGWNSWRVSNMGLLNIGRTEGTEIIQLFGRGVRLRGLDFSLKRSTALDGNHPEHIQLLENLNIFAVRANYMAQFRQYLEREGIETESSVEILLSIKPNRNFLKKGLVVPRIQKNREFAHEYEFTLEPDASIKVNVDLTLKVQSIISSNNGTVTQAVNAGTERPIPAENMALIDWNQLYLELLEYKEKKGYFNLAVKPDSPRQILTFSVQLYNLSAHDAVFSPRSFEDRRYLQDAALFILRKYMDKFYKVHQEQWATKNMEYRKLTEKDENFKDYTIKVPRSKTDLINAVQDLIKDAEKLYQQEIGQVPRIHFDRHLYQPLLVRRDDKYHIVPAGLNESEHAFVKDLKIFCRNEKDKKLAQKEVFLLRNLTRGKGIGFFDKRGFYPDFILWTKDGKSQRIIFVEPHGMLHADAYIHDDKARLHEDMPHLAKSLGVGKLKNIKLDSFIVSATPYETLRKKYADGTWDRKKFADKHILFQERNEEYDYLAKIFE
jgi:hypothetical protein